MVHRKKLKYLENTTPPPAAPPVNLRDRQNNYINLARKSLNPETVNLNMSDAEGLQGAYATKNRIYKLIIACS